MIHLFFILLALIATAAITAHGAPERALRKAEAANATWAFA